MCKFMISIEKAICFLMAIVFLTGCGLNSPRASILNPQSDGNSSITMPEQATGNGTGYMAPVVEALDVNVAQSEEDEQEQIATRESLGLTQDGILTRIEEQKGNYAFDILDDSSKILYVEILTILENHAENVKVSTNDSDLLQKVFHYVHADHPEIYWIDGYSYMRYTQGNQIVYLTFSGKYTYSVEETRNYQVKIDQYVSQCFAGIPISASDYEKVKYIYEYLINHTEYVVDSRDNQNILSVFLYGESVCQGYAKAMQYLLIRLGVPCTMVVGRVESGEGHAWNLVNIDGAYYYVDPTWGDASYRMEGTAVSGEDMPISYEFLNITTEQLTATHVIDSAVPMPQCISTAANYYIKENLYLTAYDEEQLSQIFQSAYENGQETVTVKCSEEAVFNEMLGQLISQQKIFLFLDSSTESVVYATDEQAHTLSVWL